MISPLVAATLLTNYHHGGANGTITRVVIHATVSPCVRGGARGNAHYFQSPDAGGAAHYIVDPTEIICSVDENTVAYHAPPNSGSIGIELCDPQAGDGARWQDSEHKLMLALAARLTADICRRNNVPLIWRSSADLLAGAHGITSHANVAQAWHKTDHIDPGSDFPTDHFMQLMAGNAPPAPAPTTEDIKVLHLIKGDQKPEWYVTDWITKMHVLSQDHANNIIFNTVSGGGKITFDPNNQPHVFPQAWIDALR